MLRHIFLATCNGMANRQIARTFGCAPSTVTNQLSRLGRHCLLFQRHFTEHASPAVDIALDGLVSYETSQYYPFEHLVSVDNDTSFILHFADIPLRRSGRMTPKQKAQRAKLEERHGRPSSRAAQKAADEVLRESLPAEGEAVVRSDEHKAYERALRQIGRRGLSHHQTSSRDYRGRHNALFEINSLDSFLRHSSANHRRETIAPSKRRQGSTERLAVFTVWRNFVKRRWENGPDVTPAMLRQITDRVLTVEDILARRLFVTHERLSAWWSDYYWRRVETVVLPVNRQHNLKFAF